MTIKSRRKSVVLIDPVDRSLGTVVQEHETTSAKIRAKRQNPYRWCFCELCGRSTEWEEANEDRTVFKKLLRGNARAVPLFDVVRRAAKNEADLLVARYQEALDGKFGPFEVGEMLFKHCNMQELRGDRSVKAFRLHVELRIVNQAWASQGDLLSARRLPSQLVDAPKPSKLYCEAHNPRRSIEARRAYQRDRRFVAEYEELISAIWSKYADQLPTWDIEAHAAVRIKAYHLMQSMKSPYSKIKDLLQTGTMNQSEIAKHLGMSRQAVSIAIKRHAIVS